MGNQSRIIHLFQSAKKQEAGRPSPALVALIVMLVAALTGTAAFAVYRIWAAGQEVSAARKQVAILQTGNEALAQTVTRLQADAERQKTVRLYEEDLKLREVELSGSGITGSIQNYGRTGFGDITLTALVQTADGTRHEKTVVVKSSDSRPLLRWQRRPFRIVLDIDPGEDARAAVYITDLEVAE